MGLKEYQSKRDFRRTPEPRGGAPAGIGGKSYVIQKHAARRLHYDLRLELDGVLLSWAVPKGPSLDPGEKRLAVHVEDHPLEYGGFEGNIPQGEYGGGTVMLWDRGTWEPEGDPREGLRRGDLKFTLRGEKLRGSWVLLRMGRPDPGGSGKENWLWIKHADAASAPLEERDVLKERPSSVSTGRSMEEIAADGGPQWTAQGETVPPPGPGGLPGAVRAALPDRVTPQLATLAEHVPGGDRWLHEIKFDGYRALCRIEGGRARFYTREGNDWTGKFGRLPEEAASLPVRTALLDGEVVAVLEDGSTSFQALQNALGKGGDQPVYYAFDILHHDGFDLRGSPLEERKRLLRSLIGEGRWFLRYSDHFEGDAEELFQKACEHSLEGIVSKRRDRPYVSGRSTDWLKTKCRNRQEFVIGGFTDPAGSRKGFGALLVGLRQNGDLVYCGKVGTGYTDRTLAGLFSRLRQLIREQSPFSDPPAKAAARTVHWVRPELVAEVQFSGWTRQRMLRHPSFQGLREDKSPDEVQREIPAPAAGESRVAGLSLSKPDRALYPEEGITKLELARYYEAAAHLALPRIQDRPLMLLRCPDGAGKERFFQRHASESAPEAVRRIPVDDGMGLAVDSARGLVALAQMGALEVHCWGARIDRLERPDLMVFDLDPDPAVGWPDLIGAALEIRALLEYLGLRSFVKTTGGKGLHIVVPLLRKAGWDDVKEFSKEVAEALAARNPARYVAVRSKVRRKGKIFVDYLRNVRGATFVCPYSPRGRPGALVSAPVEWEELSPGLRPEQFSIRSMPERLARQRRDPWEGIGRVRQSITSESRNRIRQFRQG